MKKILAICLVMAVISSFSSHAAVESKTAVLKPGGDLVMGVNYVRYNTVLQADFTFTDFSSVMVGRGGEGVYRAHWLEVTPVYLIIRECNYLSYKDENGKKKSRLDNYIREAYRHGLDIKQNLSVTVVS